MLDPNIFTSKIEKRTIRDGYGEGVVEAGEKNEDVVVLCADVTESTRSHLFKERFPERFVEVGVAEQNMAGIAAGLALSGKIPYMASYGVFNPGRNLDQIRISIAHSKANVKIIGSHGGVSAAGDGATHQATEDIAIMRVLPNVKVVVPADYNEAKKATIAAGEIKGPIYIRLAREKTPVFTTEKTHFEIGKAQILTTGKDVTIIAAGPVTYEALCAAEELKLKYGIRCDVINCSTIKPLDKKTIIESAGKTRRILTVEEHQIAGGLGGAVAEFLSSKLPLKIRRLGIKDEFTESGQYGTLMEKYGLSSGHIVREVRNYVF